VDAENIGATTTGVAGFGAAIGFGTATGFGAAIGFGAGAAGFGAAAMGFGASVGFAAASGFGAAIGFALGAAAFFGAAFFGAAFTAFLAIFALVRFFAFAFTADERRFPACNFFLAALDLAAARLAFLAFGRFFDLLFFAMVLPLLASCLHALRVVPKMSAVICDAGVGPLDCVGCRRASHRFRPPPARCLVKTAARVP
jgi:hypothetical protein